MIYPAGTEIRGIPFMNRLSEHQGSSNTKNIFYIKQYGKIHVCLAEILETKHMTRNALARATNTIESLNLWHLTLQISISVTLFIKS